MNNQCFSTCSCPAVAFTFLLASLSLTRLLSRHDDRSGVALVQRSASDYDDSVTDLSVTSSLSAEQHQLSASLPHGNRASALVSD